MPSFTQTKIKQRLFLFRSKNDRDAFARSTAFIETLSSFFLFFFFFLYLSFPPPTRDFYHGPEARCEIIPTLKIRDKINWNNKMNNKDSYGRYAWKCTSIMAFKFSLLCFMLYIFTHTSVLGKYCISFLIVQSSVRMLSNVKCEREFRSSS